MMPESANATGFQFQTIGRIHSCFKEKFGIPRQPGLALEATATLELLPPYDREEALQGLEGFSHLWILFIFHHCLREQWRPTVRPPRLGGNQRLGVFATRATYRPNPIGLSAVQLEGYGREDGKLLLHLRGADLADATPVIDIKPYLPYADAIPEARAGFASGPPEEKLEIVFSPRAAADIRRRETDLPALKGLITQLLATDPRPAYYEETEGERVYGMRLYDFDLRWRMEGGKAVVVELRSTEA